MNKKNSRYISIRKAAEHNLKNIDLDIPRDQLVIITGLSGSGKSSLAFDTIYAEGQRRYIESLSSYARQFLGQMEKPNVESIEGLTPTIAIEQRSGKPTPRSTVATSTEIYDYLRLLFARTGSPFCPECGKSIESQSAEDIVEKILKDHLANRAQITAPVVRNRKGTHKELIAALIKEGFTKARFDNVTYELENAPSLNQKTAHHIEVIIDRLIIKQEDRFRIADAVEIALKIGNGLCLVLLENKNKSEEILFSENFACPDHGTILNEMSPRTFSFNSPYGACEACFGLGNLMEMDESLVIPNENLSLKDGAIRAWRKCGSGWNLFYNNSVIKLAKMFNVSVDIKWKDLPADKKKQMLYGSDFYQGILPGLKARFDQSMSENHKARIHGFMSDQTCPVCMGNRLQKASLAVKIQQKNIAEIVKLTVEDSIKFFTQLKLDKEKTIIATPIIKSILDRLHFLSDVGLGYLKIDRATRSLSGGEIQRIKLASQIGAKLSGVTYVLDEPTIGLHQRDNDRLLKTLIKLRDLGNTVLVVEHDEDVIMAADYLIDIGPGAGEKGGKIVAQGSPQEVCTTDSLTGKYLIKKVTIQPDTKKRSYNKNHVITIKNCQTNNLKNISASIPLGLFTCITGVSGAGKSTLINDCLAPAVKNILNNNKVNLDKYSNVFGVQKLERVVIIDQSPIGKTSRSNPATFIGFFDHIRNIFASMSEALARGYKPSRFSFNVKGGRCEDCQGQGLKTVEMHFLPDVSVVCETCRGKRYNKETLSIKFKGKTIDDVLNMEAEKACEFFANHKKIYAPLKMLTEIGLGYVKLGQPSPTLSGGESQRMKLCGELASRNASKTIYFMDEPTTGLHFQDIDKLLKIIYRLVERNNTVVVIEHNLDVIKCADWVLDLGPDSGHLGGEIVAQGTPYDIANNQNSLTGHYLKKKLAS